MDARTDRGISGLTNGRHDGPNASEEDLDALADLFLGPAPARVEPKVRARRGPTVEALVLGHLPVFAAAWPSQLARHLADAGAEPVAVVRWELDALSVQWVNPAGTSWSAGVGAFDMRAAPAGLALLRAPEAHEAELVTLPEVERVSILTGADDAAIVGCYRRLKGLAQAAAERGRALPAVRLVVMGAPTERAQTAHERVVRAARAFLEADLLDPVIIPKIAPVHATTVHEGPCSEPLAAIAAVVKSGHLGELVGDGPAESRAGSPNEAAKIDAPDLVEPVAAPDRMQRVGPPPASRSGARPAPLIEPEAATPATLPGTLVAFIPGLSPLASECPGAPRVSLACDALGALHLVAGSLRVAPQVSAADPIGDLLHASVWAKSNASLLARAEGVCLSAGEPVLHLITDCTATASRLLGSPLRVHLAAPAGATVFGMVAVSLGG
ncbi:MAG: hypothetical protein IPJ41_13395 [Phycisphaerales bacterium]|nr:hypothetical protein [Phycisphaerales bacterium]